VTLKDKAEERGKEEEGEKQGAAERTKTEGVVMTPGIQGHGLSQEKDDDDGLPDESSVKGKTIRRRKRWEIKVRALLRRHRDLKRQRK